jgi:antitoxin VapB
MSRTAKVFMTNRSQAVRLPKEFQFATDEVVIRKVGEDVILSPRSRDWKTYLESAPLERRPIHAAAAKRLKTAA